MRNFMKNVDIDQIREQMSDLKDQVQELHFRKPWMRGNETSPMLFMAIGAALAWIGMALYKNRGDVATFCSNCGAKLKDSWQESGIKEKTERMFGKAKTQAKANSTGQEAYYPT